jgi:hypothetical protein
MTHSGMDRKNAFENWTAPEWDWVCTNTFEWVWIPMNAIGCAEMPLSEHCTPPECYWVYVNTFEWVGTAPENPFSASECLLVSIWQVWMHASCRSTYQIYSVGSNWEFEHWDRFRILCYRSTVMGKTCIAFSYHCQDTYGTSVLQCLVTVYFNMQENCLEDLRVAKICCI